MTAYLRIGEVAQAVGVSVDTLRRWEADGRVTFHDIFVPGADGRAVLRGLPHHLGERLRLFGYTGSPATNGQVVR